MLLFRMLTVMAAILGCLEFASADISGFFVKGKTIPRVGRSYEGMEEMEDKYMRPFVISPPSGKVIPRMGRRNFDSEGVYDIPKLDALNRQDMMNYAALYGDQFEEIPSK